MHRVIAGCNLWGLGFLLASMVLGAQQSRHHVTFGIFAIVFALFAQCLNFALFMGASKLLKEHVVLYDLPASFLDRNNALMFELLPWAFAGSLTLCVQGIVAGLAGTGEVPVLVHVALGMIAIGIVSAAIGPEVRTFRAMHGLLLEMKDAIAERHSEEHIRGRWQPREKHPDLRGRVLVYVGATPLVLVLGYKYISGLLLPVSAVAMAAIFAGLCFVLAGYFTLSSRRAAAADS